MVTAQTGDLRQELPAGTYSVRIHAPGQELEAPVTIASDKVTSVRVALKGNAFVIRP